MRGDYMLSAVTRAASEHFKGSPAIAKETILQGAPGEFLFVQQLNTEQSSDGGRYHNRFYFFDVRFHPDGREQSQYRRMAEIAEGLVECLRVVRTDDQPVRAARLRTEAQDGVLHCFADYAVRVIEAAEPQPLMQEIDHNERINTNSNLKHSNNPVSAGNAFDCLIGQRTNSIA